MGGVRAYQGWIHGRGQGISGADIGYGRGQGILGVDTGYGRGQGIRGGHRIWEGSRH